MNKSEKDKGIKSKLWSTSLFSLFEMGIRIVAVMFISPLIINALGTNHYGLWVLILSWASWFEILDLGMSGTAARYFSSAIGNKNDKELVLLWKNFKKYYRLAGLAVFSVCLLVFIVGNTTTKFLDNDVLWSFLPICIGQAIIFRHRVYIALLKGHLLHRVLIKLGICKVIAHSVLILCLYPNHLSVFSLSMLHLGLVLIEQIAIYAYARSIIPSGTEDSALKSPASEIVRFAVKNITGTASLMLRERFDSQLVASFVNLSAVSQHAVGIRFPNLLMEVSNSLFGGHLMSGFAKSEAWKSRNEQLQDLMSATRLSGFLALVSGVVLFYYGPPFLLAWLGPDFVQAGSVLQILIVGVILSVMQYPVFAVLPALNRHGMLAAALFVTALINFLLSLYLVQSIGVLGVVWATSIDMAVQSLFVLPWLVSRIFDVSPFSYVFAAVIRPLLLFALLVVPVWAFVVNWHQANGFLQVGLMSITLFVFASFVAWFFVLYKKERHFVLAQIIRS